MGTYILIGLFVTIRSDERKETRLISALFLKDVSVDIVNLHFQTRKKDQTRKNGQES